MVALDHRFHVGAWLDRRKGNPEGERVVQDVEIPVERLGEFLDWFDAEVGMRPVWLCPLIAGKKWPTYPLRPDETYVNVGFWGNVGVGPDAPNAPRNRAIEAKVHELDGHKSLYSEAFYDRETFDAAVRRRQPGARQGPVRPGSPTDQPVRQGREETMRCPR